MELGHCVWIADGAVVAEHQEPSDCYPFRSSRPISSVSPELPEESRAVEIDPWVMRLACPDSLPVPLDAVSIQIIETEPLEYAAVPRLVSLVRQHSPNDFGRTPVVAFEVPAVRTVDSGLVQLKLNDLPATTELASGSDAGTGEIENVEATQSAPEDESTGESSDEQEGENGDEAAQ